MLNLFLNYLNAKHGNIELTAVGEGSDVVSLMLN